MAADTATFWFNGKQYGSYEETRQLLQTQMQQLPQRPKAMRRAPHQAFCRNQHELIKCSTWSSRVKCDGATCGIMVECGDVTYGCRQCNYALCEDCRLSPKQCLFEGPLSPGPSDASTCATPTTPWSSELSLCVDRSTSTPESNPTESRECQTTPSANMRPRTSSDKFENMNCQWMWDDAAIGPLGFHELAIYNPLRWSRQSSFKGACKEIEKEKDESRPVRIRVAAKDETHLFSSIAAAVAYLTQEDPATRWRNESIHS